MSVNTRNSIVTNGLVLALDSLNPQSIPVDPTINLKNFSQDFTSSGGGYILDNTTGSSASFLAPDGTSTATLVTENTANSIHRLYYTTTTPSVPINLQQNKYYTVSFYAKNNGRFVADSILELPSGRAGVTYNLSTGTLTNYLTVNGFILTSSINPVGNGWYRISYTTRETASMAGGVTVTVARFYNENNSGSYTGNGLSGSYFWGYQLEQNSYATPYFPTTTTPGGRTRWNDMSGNNNVVNLITGSALAPSSSNASIPQYTYLNERVLNFDGTGSFAYIPSITTTPSPSTVSITFKRPSVTLNRLFMWDHNNGNGFGRSQRIFETSLLLIPTNNTNTTISSTAMTNALSVPNQWTNLTYTISGSIVNVYVNGISVVENFTMAAPFTSASITSPIYIGRLDSGTDSFFTTGSIGSLYIYNRVLTQAEVSQNYNAVKTRFGLT
jgi:hypothetical protein